ncbi:hypothetical protein LguiB_018198 [Lonicera macranthoides]
MDCFLLGFLSAASLSKVFVRAFVPSSLAFLMPDIVKKFLLKTLQLQGWEKKNRQIQAWRSGNAS